MGVLPLPAGLIFCLDERAYEQRAAAFYRVSDDDVHDVLFTFKSGTFPAFPSDTQISARTSPATQLITTMSTTLLCGNLLDSPSGMNGQQIGSRQTHEAMFSPLRFIASVCPLSRSPLCFGRSSVDPTALQTICSLEICNVLVRILVAEKSEL